MGTWGKWRSCRSNPALGFCSHRAAKTPKSKYGTTARKSVRSRSRNTKHPSLVCVYPSIPNTWYQVTMQAMLNYGTSRHANPFKSGAKAHASKISSSATSSTVWVWVVMNALSKHRISKQDLSWKVPLLKIPKQWIKSVSCKMETTWFAPMTYLLSFMMFNLWMKMSHYPSRIN